ncbi:MAG: FtsX-like permease family protein [Proteobacteria bacterium]|nr:FtsX-like permease family protein [Pseudomonadota bacterium]
MDAPYIGRLLNILDYALSSLRRKLLKNFGVFTVFSVVIFLFSSFQLTSRALTEIARQTLTTAPDITVQQMSAGRQSSIPLAAKEQLAAIFGIKKIDARIWGYYFDESNGANYTVIGMDTMPDHAPGSPWPGLSEGRLPTAGETGKAVISAEMRRQLQLGERKFFSLFRPDLSLASFETVGIFSKDSDLVTADLILMTMGDARNLFAIPDGLATDLLVQVGNPLEIDTITGKIRDKLAGVRVITRAQIQKTYEVVFSWRSGLGTICLLTALVSFVILAWDKASGLSQSELREVGILKILGWQTGDIMLLRFFESATVALFAFLTGWLLAWVHVGYFAGALFRPIFLGWSVLRPDLAMVPPLVFSDVLLVFSISVLPYLCATAVPAWRAAVVRADSVL